MKTEVWNMSNMIELAKVEDIPKNEMHVFNVGKLEILVANVDGEFYAVENRCPHMGYPLFFGTLKGKILKCGFHNAEFDLSSGKALNEVTGKPLRVFKLAMQDSQILVEL